MIGRDVSRSPSPLLHEAAARACGLSLSYIPLNCDGAEDFKETVQALLTLNARGANVTIPYKLDAAEIADSLSPVAKDLGAVNTLSFADDGSIEGDNTDAPALLEVLRSFPDEARQSVQLLGAGGAARAAAWALKAWGAEEVVVCARRGAEEVAEAYGFSAASLAPVSGARLVLSTLPGDGALAHRIVSEWVDSAAEPFVCDAAYGEPVSPLVAAARELGWPSMDGRRMLVEQAARSLAHWMDFEVEPLREAMGKVLPFDSNPGLS